MPRFDTDIQTPAFFVKRKQLIDNCRRVAELASTLGVYLRPHVKTHKTIEAANIQLQHLPKDQGSQGGIVVSTLQEAEYYAEHGFEDILFAQLVEPHKIVRIIELHKRINRLHVFVDSIEACDHLEATFRAHSIRPFSVFLCVDCGNHREGVEPELHETIDLARHINQNEALELTGIYSHSGDAYNTPNGAAGAQTKAEFESLTMKKLKDKLKTYGIECAHVSVGSTPSCCTATSCTGCTEIHPGNYVFFDRQQMASGSCTQEEVACYVSTRVIGRYPHRNELLIDAGSCALHKDPGGVKGWGIIDQYPDLLIERITQEAGVITSSVPIPFDEFPLGTILRIIPNHSCMTAAMHPRYYVVHEANNNDNEKAFEIVDEWVPCRGW